MKKEYIAPASQLRVVAAQQMMAISLVEDEDKPAIPNTDPNADGDGLAKSGNLWETEW